MTAADFSLNTLGMFCPIPVILTSKKIKIMAPGQTLEILSDDPGIKKDMPIWCKNSGNELISLSETDGVITLCLRKRA